MRTAIVILVSRADGNEFSSNWRRCVAKLKRRRNCVSKSLLCSERVEGGGGGGGGLRKTKDVQHIKKSPRLWCKKQKTI